MDRDAVFNMGIEADEREDFELAQACEDALSGDLAEWRYLENLLYWREEQNQ